MKRQRVAHRIAAVIIMGFVLIHLANHLALFSGIEAHISFMEEARKVYRHPVVESALLVCVALQAVSGIALVRSALTRRLNRLGWLKVVSGSYLAFFLVVHVSAVLLARVLFNLDTNVHFAAAGLQTEGIKYFFIPYYFFSVVALFAHLGSFAARRSRSLLYARAIIIGFSSIGAAFSAFVLAALLGVLYPYSVPKVYRNMFSAKQLQPMFVTGARSNLYELAARPAAFVT